jgi:hypothetical protein
MTGHLEGFADRLGAGRGAVMVIRAWVEDDGRLRARITKTLDVASRNEETTVVLGTDQVLAQVERWLQAFMHERS